MGNCCKRLGIYELVTNGIVDNGTNALFGIDPRTWTCLPCEGLVLIKFRQDIPTSANALPVALAVPTCGTVTTVSDGSFNTVSSIEFTTIPGGTITGADFITNTERLAYFNKARGILRLLSCCQNSTTTTNPV